MLLQPQSRPFSQEQVVNEVKGIYAGLVMVEKKCVEICQQQAQTINRLSTQQWQALIALHRTLMHDHHDFFLASQHPTASPALRRLPTKYAMPARRWRHETHSFLQLLRYRLPHSLEHMLSFVYLAYQMMGLLTESVPAFHETWIECLGDLARYRMAIEKADMRDRELWSNVAGTRYNKAANRLPDTGRIQHHLAVLARPHLASRLFYYSNALISVNPIPNARDSIMLLFNPLLEIQKGDQNSGDDSTIHEYGRSDNSMLNAAGILFTKGSIHDHVADISHSISGLDGHLRSSSHWKGQGPEVASELIACILDCGPEDNHQWKAFQTRHDEQFQTESPRGTKASTEESTATETAIFTPLTSKGTEQEINSPMTGLRNVFSSFLSSSRLAHILIFFAFTFPAHALDGTVPPDPAPSNRALWKSLANDLELSVTLESSSWVIPGTIFAAFEFYLRRWDPTQQTCPLSYASVTAAVVQLGLFSEVDDAAAYFLGGQFTVARYRIVMVKSRIPEHVHHVRDLVYICFGSAVAAGALCALIGGSVSFLQVFPICVLAVVEWMNGRLPPAPVLPIEDNR